MMNSTTLFEKDFSYLSKASFSGSKKLPADFIGVVEFHQSNYQAGQIIDLVYQQYLSQAEAEIINQFIGNEKADLIIKKTILYNLGNLLHSFILAEKFLKRYKIESTINFIPKAFPYSLYKILSQNKGLLPDKVRIPNWYLNKMKVQERLKSWLYRWAIRIWPLAIIFMMRPKKLKNQGKKSYNYAIHLWNNSFGRSLPYFVDMLVNEVELKNEDILYVIDKKASRGNLEKLEAKGYSYCYFEQMLKQANRLSYLKKIYPGLKDYQKKASSVRPKQRSLLSEAYLKTLRWQVLWEIFYLSYQVKTFVAVQDPGNVGRSLIQKRHGSNNLFVFMSSSVPIYPQDKELLVNTNYSFMVYDEAVSTKLSIDYLKKNKNFFKSYTELGVLKADLIYKLQQDTNLRNKLKDKLKLPKNKIIIGFFDTVIGGRGMFNQEEGYAMLSDVLRLLESNPDYYLVYKSRGNSFTKESKIKALDEKLKNHQRSFYADEESIPHYDAQTLVGVSDFVIAAITSSLVAESLSGGLKTICYVPQGRFNKDIFLMEKFPYFHTSGYQQLRQYSDYWLYQSKDKDFSDFQQAYVKKYIDKYCDGQAIKRLYSRLQERSCQ